MHKSIVSILIATLIVQFLCIAPAFGQSPNDEPQTARIKAALMKHGAGKKSKVKIKLRDGREIKGYIAGLNADDFVIADSKTNQRATVSYAETARIKKSGLSLGAKIGIGALIVGAVAAIVITAGIKDLDDNIFPN